jgi:hypothetical protein
MKIERITGIICFVIIITALTWATVIENRTEKRTVSVACEKPDAHGRYFVAWNSYCGARLTEIEELRLYNGTVCLNAGSKGWDCSVKQEISK